MTDPVRLPDGTLVDPARVRWTREPYTPRQPPGFVWVVHLAGGGAVVHDPSLPERD